MRAQLIKDQRGMTMVEVLTGFAVFTLLLSFCLGLMLISSRLLSISGEKDRMKMAADKIQFYLRDTLAFATHLQVCTTPSEAMYDNILLIQDGQILMGKKGAAVDTYSAPFAGNVYQDSTLSTEVTVKNDYLLDLKLTFTKNGGEIYATATTLRLLNLFAGDEKIINTGPPILADAVISYDTKPYAASTHDEPYTVDKYIEKATVKDLINGTTYQPGDFVKDNNGDYWEAVQTVYYTDGDFNKYPGYNPSYLWKSLKREWQNSKNEQTIISIYEYNDVIEYNNSYYMSTHYANHWPIEITSCWMQVYWFSDYADPNARWLGWSKYNNTYVQAYTP